MATAVYKVCSTGCVWLSPCSCVPGLEAAILGSHWLPATLMDWDHWRRRPLPGPCPLFSSHGQGRAARAPASVPARWELTARRILSLLQPLPNKGSLRSWQLRAPEPPSQQLLSVPQLTPLSSTVPILLPALTYRKCKMYRGNLGLFQ